jgi:RNA-directed DNA polymerase
MGWRRRFTRVPEDAADGTSVGLQLFRASTVAVTRHVKVPGAAHPFDPEWTE